MRVFNGDSFNRFGSDFLKVWMVMIAFVFALQVNRIAGFCNADREQYAEYHIAEGELLSSNQ